MIEGIRYFTADYCDGKVYLAGKSKDAGYYAAELLNEHDRDDFTARLVVFRLANWDVSGQLRAGFLNPSDFVKAGEEIGYILGVLPRFSPFSELNIDDERKRVEELFTEEKAEQIREYFRQRSLAGTMDYGYIIYRNFPRGYDEAFCKEVEKLLDNVLETLDFYDRIGEEVRNVSGKLKMFVDRTAEAERCDEEHLLPIALDIFGPAPFDVTTEYVPLRKSARSKMPAVARRLHFKNYYSFILTDFFEGLKNGHYPRRCRMCRRYFVMTSARKTMYCDGWANELWRGRKISCRNLAAQLKKKERAANDPVSVRYNSRCSAIRVEKGRGTITGEFADAAKALAKEHKQRAKTDPEYAAKQYAEDMESSTLYAAADALLK